MKKVIIAIVLAVALVAGGPGGFSYVSAQPDNSLLAHFENDCTYDVPGDIFKNQQVAGRSWYATSLLNNRTGAEVSELGLTLDTTLGFDYFQTENLVSEDPPQWSFSNVADESRVRAYVGFESVDFTPGFDASRFLGKTDFWQSEGTQIQNLTITLTPRDTTNLGVLVEIPRCELVDAVIISVTADFPISADEFDLSPNELHICPAGLELDKTYTYYVTIEVTPKVPGVMFLPYVSIGTPPRELEIHVDAPHGKSLTYKVAEIGTWKWSTTQDYDWCWVEDPINQHVNWRPACEEIVNKVEAYFAREWIYLSPGDTFENHQVEGEKEWSVKLHNSPDDTGAPLTGLALTLASEWEFDDIWPDPDIMGPPTYEWSFPDVPEGSDLLASVGSVPVTFTPGFDASRSVDITRFLQSEGTQTQTLTITLTPRDVTEGIRIHVIAWENDLIASVITSPTGGEGVWLFADGHELVIEPKGLESGTTYTYTVTIEVTPKVTRVEFIPFVSIPRHEVLASGSTTASSVSYTSEIGTWTWSAEGSYEWQVQPLLTTIVHWYFWSWEIVPVARASVDTYLAPVGSPFTFFGVASTGPIESWEWNFDDGTSDSGLCVAHAYAAPGLYDVVLTVTDDIGLTDTDTVMVVVYDPEAGFVTGGGWIYSDAGADRMNPSAEGKATFGFVSKYKKGATEPTGQTQFQFKAGDLNFHSTEYQWLVVNQSDTNAQFKGIGTINGMGVYKFMLWAGDGDPDTFRIKIWEEDENGTETVRYDNGFHQPIGGGSIVIHKK